MSKAPSHDPLGLVNTIIDKYPTLRYQPIWNLVNPAALHQGEVVDQEFKDVNGFTPAGKPLGDSFPNMKLRDLPVFEWLPPEIPRDFAWNAPMGVTLSKDAQPYLPFHVKNTPLQDVKFQDMVLVGRREEEVKMEQLRDRQKRRSEAGTATQEMKDAQRRVEALEKKTGRLETKLEKEGKARKATDLQLVKFKVRYEQDQGLIGKQHELVVAQAAKIEQLEEVRVEQLEEIRKQEKEQEKKNKQLREAEKVLKVKDEAIEALEKEVGQEKQEAEEERDEGEKSSKKATEDADAARKEAKDAEKGAKEVKAKVREMSKKLKAADSDKAELEKELRDTTDENKELARQRDKVEELDEGRKHEEEALSRELRDVRAEKERLQKEMDALESSSVQVDPPAAEESDAQSAEAGDSTNSAAEDAE